MSFENPSQIIQSWGLTKNFAAGPTTVDKLVPPTYGKIRTPFVQTWREESLGTALDWGNSSPFSYYLPESLRVISSMFLQIKCPAIAGTANNFKPYAGLYAVRAIRLLSAGQEVYTCDMQAFLRDYCESLSDEELESFGRIYLGHRAGAATACTFLIPIPLPNSGYLQRHGHNTRGSGVWPCFTAQNRLEIQIQMNDNTFVSAGEAVPGSIAGACSMLMHQVDMAAADVLRYSDLRGVYSLINRRFTELTSGWQTIGANNLVKFNQHQPVGCVTEILVCAVATGVDEAQREVLAQVLPSKIKVIADSVTQKDLNTPEKVQMELYSNGFTQNSVFKNAGRLCFASHCAESTHHYSGGYNMQTASTVSFEFEFAEGVDYRIYAVQLQRVSIDSLGLIRASLE